MPADRKTCARRPPLDRLLLGAALVLPALYLAGRRPAPPPGPAVPTLLARLEAKGLRLHAVPADHARGDVHRGVYLCDRPREWEQVAGLPADPGQAGRWRGVVLAQASNGAAVVLDEELRSWGACGHRDGPFVFFGDPALLARLKEALAP